MKRILILEPYYGGSHKFFLDGLQQRVKCSYTLFTLPARKWKMRMQLSAPWFIDRIQELPESQRWFDTVLCSTFVDVAVLRALLAQVKGWNKGAAILTYFHENQFVYPAQYGGKTNVFAFTAINFNTALASDRIAFNSSFNKESFLNGCRRYLKNASDMKFPETIDSIEKKSSILFPGIDFTEIDRENVKDEVHIPVIVWNHRWEHDKNPEEFFTALRSLYDDNIDFRLIILGQSFANSPLCFQEAGKTFNQKIIHYGFADSYEEYVRLLCRGDIVVSTSLHEFYGISIIEAVRAGCIPVLPDRLSYPEIFPGKYLYSQGTLVEKLRLLINKKERLQKKVSKKITEKCNWQNLQHSYQHWLFEE